MNLPGRLRLTTLGDVLGAVYREGATGVLELTPNTGTVHRVHFEHGLVAQVESPSRLGRLGDVLRARGKVDGRALIRLEQLLVSEPARRAGDLLVAMGVVDRGDVMTALGAQRRERLERLFSLDDARLAFRVARGHPNAPAAPLEPHEFLLGRPRSRDRGATRAFGKRRDPVRARALATLGLTETADLVSVQRAFRQLASRMHPDRFPSAAPADKAAILRRFAQISAAYHSLVA